MRSVFTASCFVHYEGRVLLIHHTRLGLWLPVGGELEENEAPVSGAYRETVEETGFHVEFHHKDSRGPIGTPPGFLGYEEHLAGERGEHKNFCFLGHATHAISRDGKTMTQLPNGSFPQPRSDGTWNGFSWMIPGDSVDHLKMPPNVRELLQNIKILLDEERACNNRQFLAGE